MVACLFLSRAFISSEKRLRAADDDEEEGIESELSEAGLSGRTYGGGRGEEEEEDTNAIELVCETLRIEGVDALERGVESTVFAGIDGPAALVASEWALQCKEELERDADEALAVG